MLLSIGGVAGCAAPVTSEELEADEVGVTAQALAETSMKRLVIEARTRGVQEFATTPTGAIFMNNFSGPTATSSAENKGNAGLA